MSTFSHWFTVSSSLEYLNHDKYSSQMKYTGIELQTNGEGDVVFKYNRKKNPKENPKYQMKMLHDRFHWLSSCLEVVKHNYP